MCCWHQLHRGLSRRAGGSYLSMINPLIANTIASLTPSKRLFLVDHIGSYNSFPVVRSLCIYIKINNPHGANYDATGTGNDPRVIGLLLGGYTCHRCGCAVFLYCPCNWTLQVNGQATAWSNSFRPKKSWRSSDGTDVFWRHVAIYAVIK